MPSVTTGFLAERLAKASAVPAEQRSADVRAFIETCRLQAELVEELGLPEVFNCSSQIDALASRWTAGPALKLVRSHSISHCSRLEHCPQLQRFAYNMMLVYTSFRPTGTLPTDLGWS